MCMTKKLAPFSTYEPVVVEGKIRLNIKTHTKWVNLKLKTTQPFCECMKHKTPNSTLVL